MVPSFLYLCLTVPAGPAGERLPLEVLAQLREDILPAAIGFVVCGLALATGALAFLQRRRSASRNLIDLALLSGLYGIRLLADTHAATLLFAIPDEPLERFTNVVTYLVAIPAALFFESILGYGWQRLLRRFWQLMALLAVVAVPAEILAPSPGALLLPYRILVVVGTVVAAAHLFWPGQARDDRFRWLRASFAVLALFVVNENLQDMGFTPWEADLEPVGFLLAFGGLGLVAARGLLDSQEQFASVRQELETARQIQAATLPQETPRLAGLELAVRYVPAESVAGDFYDFLPVGEQGLGIIVADVSGHGVPAALVASMLKVAVASQAEHAASPARVLSGMNQLFHGKLRNQFITTAYVFLDLEAGRLTYASAGHPPPLLWRQREGRVEELAHGGLVMGRLKRASYTEAAVTVEPGDRLLLFTDGIPEAARASGEPFGEKGLYETLTAQSALLAEPFAEALLARVGKWTGRRDFEDDLTLVVACFTDPAASSTIL